jgi:hypothetical protein
LPRVHHSSGLLIIMDKPALVTSQALFVTLG